MLIAENAALRMEVREQGKKIARLTDEVSYLQSMVDIRGVSKIFSELAPRSIYRGLFASTYRDIILGEIIVRYQMIGVEGPTDRKVVINVMNNVGREAASGVITLHSGERVRTSGG